MQIKPSLSGWNCASNFTKWHQTRYNWDPMWSNFKPRSMISELPNVDIHLSMKEHVQRICQSSFHQLRQIRTVRTSLTRAACESLVHTFVSSRLDYCNSMLFGINESLLDKLESMLCTAAHLVLQKRKFDSIYTDICDKLHWLPIHQGIEFKICVLVYRCLHGTAPDYLAEMLTLTADVPALQRHRSAALGTLVLPMTVGALHGPRSFR